MRDNNKTIGDNKRTLEQWEDFMSIISYLIKYYIHDEFHFHCSLHLRDTEGHFDPSQSLTLQKPCWTSKSKVADYRKERKI